MPPPNIPTVDPNSNIGRRLLARPQAGYGSDAEFAELIRQQNLGAPFGADRLLAEQHAAASGQPGAIAGLPPPPAGLLPAAPASPPPAAPGAGSNPFRDGTGSASPTPSPAVLAEGNTPLAPVQTQDPFRMLPERVVPDRTLSDGTILPGDFFGPGRASMSGAGFQPGLVQIGGMTTYSSNPAEYLMQLQQQARVNGVNPQFTAEQFLGAINSGADRSARSGVAAQAGTVNLATGRMSADAQRYGADRQADATGRAAAFSAIPGFMAGLSAGNIPPPVAELIGGHITRAVQGGGVGGGVPPFGGPMGPGGPAPGFAPGGPGAPAGGTAPANPFAAAAASGDFLRPLQGLFGTRNAQGVWQTPENFDINAAAGQFLDRFNTGTPEQRAAAVAAVERGDLGNADQLMRAVARQYALSTMRTEGESIAPGNPGWANILMQSPVGAPLAWLHGGSAAPPQRVMPLANGQPFATFGNDPRQGLLQAGAGALTSGGVPFNRATIPGFDPVDFNRTEVNNFFNRNNSTAERDRRLRAAAESFLSQTTRYKNATAAPRR